MPEHKQVLCKVNAYVDEKIAPVIEAMSKIPNLVTEFSCEDNRSEVERNSGGYIPRAYVMFHTKDKYENWQALGTICDMLSKAIAGYSHAELFIRWKEGKPVGLFEFNTEDAYWLTMTMNEFLRDKEYTKSGS